MDVARVHADPGVLGVDALGRVLEVRRGAQPHRRRVADVHDALAGGVVGAGRSSSRPVRPGPASTCCRSRARSRSTPRWNWRAEVGARRPTPPWAPATWVAGEVPPVAELLLPPHAPGEQAGGQRGEDECRGAPGARGRACTAARLATALCRWRHRGGAPASRPRPTAPTVAPGGRIRRGRAGGRRPADRGDEPGQGVLRRAGRHQARPGRVLPQRARAVHGGHARATGAAAALPERSRGHVVLPEADPRQRARLAAAPRS